MNILLIGTCILATLSYRLKIFTNIWRIIRENLFRINCVFRLRIVQTKYEYVGRIQVAHSGEPAQLSKNFETRNLRIYFQHF